MEICTKTRRITSQKILYTIVLLLIGYTVSSQVSFIRKYSGSYNIMVGNDGSEGYALKEDGSAVWIYGWKDSSGKIQFQKKYGSWQAADGYIKVMIKGYSGIIVEEYKFKGGRFVSLSNSDAYLRKN